MFRSPPSIINSGANALKCDVISSTVLLMIFRTWAVLTTFDFDAVFYLVSMLWGGGGETHIWGEFRGGVVGEVS